MLKAPRINEQEFVALTHKYRDEPAHSIEFSPCLEKLVDYDHVKQVSKLIQKTGVKWERLSAVDDLHQSLPAVKGVYMFVWKPKIDFEMDSSEAEHLCWILYVGKAGIEGGTHDTIKDRYRSEYSNYVGRDASVLWEGKAATNREQKLSRYLTLRPLEYWFLDLQDTKERDITLIERHLLRCLRPPLNKQYGAVLRAGKTGPAFR